MLTTFRARCGRSLLFAFVTLAAVPVPAAQQAPEVIVTATRFEDDVRTLPVNATVITAQEIARSPARSVPQLLATQAGISVRELYGSATTGSSVDLRGFGVTGGQNTLILLDGRRLNDIDLSGIQWSSVPLDQVERIEIVRGGGAVQYGDGATAGVINIVTRGARTGRSGLAGGLRFGSLGTIETFANGALAGASGAIEATVRNHESDGYRDNNRNRESSLLAAGRWGSGSTDLSVRLAADRQGTRLPGARQVQPSAGVDLLSTHRRGAATPRDYAQRDGMRIDADLRHEIGPAELVLAAGYREKAQRSYFDFGGFPDYREIDLDVTSFNPRVRLRFDTFGVAHSLVAGIDLARWGYGLRRSNAVGGIATPFNTVAASQKNEAMYLQDTLRFGERVTVQLGARSERQRIAATDVHDATAPGGAFGSGAPAGSDAHTENAAEAGVRLQLARGAALVARAGRSFRFATVDEIYETSPAFVQQFQFLRPQTARSSELGAELGAPAQAWLRAALFRIDVDDEIHLDPFTSGVGNTNLPPSRREGLELEARVQPTRALGVSGAYAYTRARFREGTLPGGAFTQLNVSIAGRSVPLVPEHRLSLAANWAAGERTVVSGVVRYASRQFMDNDEGNTLGRAIPAYAVADLKVAHRVGALRLSAAIENLFDRKYYTYAVRSQFVADRFNAYPLPERTIMFTLEYVGL